MITMRILKKVLFSAILLAVLPANTAFADQRLEALPHQKTEWTPVLAHTVEDFGNLKNNPKTDRFGGWKSFTLEASGWFRVARHEGRWWYITPEGHPFLSMAVTTVAPGSSTDQKETCKETFRTVDKWADETIKLLKESEINSMGCWTSEKNFSGKYPYTAFVSIAKPFASKKGISLTTEKDRNKAMALVLSDPEFAGYAEKKIAEAVSKIGDDNYCIGWFTDNELPWDRHHPEILEQYLSLVSGILRKYDPNRLYLGCRFNSWANELSSPEMIRIAGKYMDVISLNHYNFWEPDFRQFDRFEAWGGKPAMVTEFYAKGEDSGMPNTSGGGWVVHTQADRGLFYQNFVLELLKSPACVGWQWFRYQDNDVNNTKSDPSNRDSNKGIVDGKFQPYGELLSAMKAINTKAYDLATSLYKRRIEGTVKDASTGKGIAGVAVSDGYGVVLTDEEGCYQFPLDDRKQLIAITVPSAYELPLFPGTGHPAHYGGPDFVLTPMPEGKRNFELIAIGDPQARSENQAKRYINETLKDVQANAGQRAIAFALGDIVSDSDPTWDIMFNSGRNLKNANGETIPYFSVMGNHDSDRYDDPVDSSAVHFEKSYGPRNFSIDRDGVHIVVMDDIFRTKPKTNKSINGRTWQYNGGLTIEQYRWLLDDFSKVENKENKTLVFCCHIPFNKKQVKERRDLVLTAFTQFGHAHILCGHRHFTENTTYDDYICKGGTPVYCHTHVAAGGNVWASSIAYDACPNGYAVYELADGNMQNWHFKGTGMDKTDQFAVYNGDDSYSLKSGRSISWPDEFKGSVVVDLWNDDTCSWKVELFSNGKKVGDFVKMEGNWYHPVKIMIADSDRHWGELSTWEKKDVPQHLWTFKPKSGKPSKIKNWEVRATQTIPGSGVQNVYIKTAYTK